MIIIILAVGIIWVLRVAIKGLLSVGAGQGDRPEKGKKSRYGICHFFGCLFQGLNPVTDSAEPILAWILGKLKKYFSILFWSPNWIWKHLWPDTPNGKTLLRVKACTVIFWIIFGCIAFLII
ncbi:MAG: hypothetical protein HFJ18_00335 [Clostridia bacterium]|nr:hypothetical protein [Clostridia bacterium]